MVRLQLVYKTNRVVRELVDTIITEKSAKKFELLKMVLEDESPYDVETILKYFLVNEKDLR